MQINAVEDSTSKIFSLIPLQMIF